MTLERARDLALRGCSHCGGLGWWFGRSSAEICGCVWRAVYRRCLAEYLECRRRQENAGVMSGGWVQVLRGVAAGRPHEEFVADFELAARRELDAFGLRVWRLTLAGKPAPACAIRLGCDEGRFWHAVYRVQESLGRAFAETRPYGLYPPARYYGVA